MLTTTLNEILKHKPCASGWDELTGQGLDKSKWTGNDEPIGFDVILSSNGLDDALWALRALKGENLKQAKLFICDIAERVLKFVPDGENRPRNAIEMSRKFINGECSLDELNEAREGATAAAAADADAAYAAYAAADAAYAAANAYYAAAYAAGELEQEAQKQMFIKFINSIEG